MVIDVGAVYDHSIRRYDHHQRSFVSTLKEEHPDVPLDARPDCSTKLSACGLVYKHYGLQELFRSELGGKHIQKTEPTCPPQVRKGNLASLASLNFSKRHNSYGMRNTYTRAGYINVRCFEKLLTQRETPNNV